MSDPLPDCRKLPEQRQSAEGAVHIAVASGKLRKSDLLMFERLRIPSELLVQAGIERVSDCEARDTYGIISAGDMAGVLFPYIDPRDGLRKTARIRRDNPEIEA